MELLKDEIGRHLFGGVEFVTGSLDGWTVYLRDADDLPACQLHYWAGLPIRYLVLPRTA